MADSKGENGDPSIIFGQYDLNTSSTLELTEVAYNVSTEEEKTQTKKIRKINSHGTSDLGAILHVIKSSLGTGVLASAEGFKNAGYITGIIGTIIVGILCTHCTHIMVKCSQLMCEKEEQDSLGFGETVQCAMKRCRSKNFRKVSILARTTADGFMFFTYYGVTTVYVLLVSETFKQIFENHMKLEYDIRIYIAMITVPVYIVGMIRSMKYLVPFSAFANLCLLSGLCLTFYFVLQDLPSLSSRNAVAPLSRLPLFISTVLFGMEGIGTMLPIESSMKHPQHFLGCPGVLNFSMIIVVGFFMFVGLLGYIKFGEEATGSITLNLPDNIFAELVKGLVGLAILFSYGLQMTAAIDVVWRSIETRFHKDHLKCAYYLVRAVLILGTVIIAVAVPTLGPVISLVGAVGFSSCGLFYPALTETAILMNTGFGKWNWKLLKNVFLMVMAVIAIVSGSIASISDIVKQYNS